MVVAEGERRGERAAAEPRALGTVPNPEVPAKPTRRRFTAEYKLRTVREADSQREAGAIGALLRREGPSTDSARSRARASVR